MKHLKLQMRHVLIAMAMLVGPVSVGHSQVSVGISTPGLNIGINMPVYPQLVRVPGYPVYYDPRANSNYFFYDGLYWVYQSDNWYASSWYNGPWQSVGPDYVPVYVLRVPVRYYRQPPPYFHGWRADAPPRWGEHYGRGWEDRRGKWDRWDHRTAPRPAPLPVYQQHYSGDRYPGAVERQHAIRAEKYPYQPRDAMTRQQFQERNAPPVAGRAPPQQAPISPRSSTPPQRAEVGQPRPSIPAPPPPQQQHAPQDKGHDGKGDSQGKGHDNKPDYRQDGKRQ